MLCQENTQVVANTFFQPHNRQLYIWSSPDGQYNIFKLIILLAAKKGEALRSQQKRLGADCGSDHEFHIAKFRLKLKKIGKTTVPFGYD